MSPVEGRHTRFKGRKQRQLESSDHIGQIFRRINVTRHVEKDDIMQLFHLHTPVCYGCRGNTKDSPNCFCGLVPPPNGTRKQGLWQKLSDTMEELGPDPSESLRPSQTSPSGLTNLGATCYVNSVLQCLYMNSAFRNGLFSAEFDLVREQPVLHQICRLFAQLHSGVKVAVDSAPFASTLELDNAVQQDGQEFLKLLLTLLEGLLGPSRNSKARNVVQNEFRGTFSYVTKCRKCGQESEASKEAVDFYELELNVKGFSSLDESLSDYLSEENLQGENQYKCESCNTRVDATHSTKLRSLPPVLNFQLKRFLFNPKTATKKKVTSKFNFPRTLNMCSRLLSKSSGQSSVGDSAFVYDLAAILVHKGSMANSGHYVAHIIDEQTGEWWQFDDEKVTSLGFHPLGELSDSRQVKETSPANYDQATVLFDGRKKWRKGDEDLNWSGTEIFAVTEALESDVLTSADAYMLMYRRRDRQLGQGCILSSSDLGPVSFSETSDCDRVIQPRSDSYLPSQFQVEVKQMNREFKCLCQDYQKRRENELSRINDRRLEVRSVLEQAPVANVDVPFFWISVEWLRLWADSVDDPGSINNGSLLCQHRKVSPSKLLLMKRISQSAWSYLYTKYQGGPVICGDDFCLDCIFEDAKIATSADRFRDQRASMREVVDDVLSGRGVLDGTLYYVSKTWLTQWVRRKAADAPSDVDAGPTAGLRCPHGGLVPEQVTGAKRQLIPERAWQYIYENAVQVPGADPYGHCPFREDTVPCAICQSELEKIALMCEDLRASKIEQRTKHEALYGGRVVSVLPGAVYHLVPSVWLNRWRAYLGASGKNLLTVDEPDGLEGLILSLLCQKHEGMLFKPPTLVRTRRGELMQRPGNEDTFTVVTHEDWLGLCQQWDIDPQKGIEACLDTKMYMSQKRGSTDCDDCPRSCTYKGAKGEVEAVSFVDAETGVLFEEADCRSEFVPLLKTVPEVCKECTEEREVHELLSKLNYTCGEISVDLVRGKGPPPSLLAASGLVETERRTSKRARRASVSSAGRVLLKVSGETTVFQLKLQIWESMAIVRENQRVHFGKTELSDDSATLADLNILPRSQLWVMDTGQHENCEITEELSAAESGRAETEEGFRGTRLVMGLPSILESRSACLEQKSQPSSGTEGDGEGGFKFERSGFCLPLIASKVEEEAEVKKQGAQADVRHSERERCDG